MTKRNKIAGYVLLEVLVSAIVLSIGIVALTRAFVAVIYEKSVAQDFTTAKLLAEGKMSELESAALTIFRASAGRRGDPGIDLRLGDAEGDFGSQYPGFHWRTTLQKRIHTETVTFPPDDEEQCQSGYLAAGVNVTWTKKGEAHKVSLAALFPYVPTEEDAGG